MREGDTMSAKTEISDASHKKIVQRLGRLGDEFAWLDRLMIDWGDGKPREAYVAGLPDGAFVLPLLENGNVLLVHQYRLFNGGWRYEVPGGIVDKGESEEAAALRELEEEAGYKAGEMEKLLDFRPDPMLQTTTHLYVARDLMKTKQRLDRGEAGMTVVEVTPAQFYEMTLDGTITDARTILAALVAKERGILLVGSKQLKKGHPF